MSCKYICGAMPSCFSLLRCLKDLEIIARGEKIANQFRNKDTEGGDNTGSVMEHLVTCSMKAIKASYVNVNIIFHNEGRL